MGVSNSRILEIILKAKDETEKALSGAEKNLENFNLKAAAIGAGMLAAGAGIDKGLTVARDAAVSYAKEIITLQRLTGMSAEEASKMTAVFQRYGIEGSKIATIVKKLSTSIEGKSEALRLAGIATQNADGSNRTSMEVLADLAEYYKNAEDKTKAVKVASEALGKGYGDLLPILAGGKEAIQGITDAAEKNGAIYSQAELDKVKAYNKALADNKAAVEATTREIGLATLPWETFKQQALGGILETLNAIDPKVVTVGTGLASLSADGLTLAGQVSLALMGVKTFIDLGLAAWLTQLVAPLGKVILAFEWFVSGMSLGTTALLTLAGVISAFLGQAIIAKLREWIESVAKWLGATDTQARKMGTTFKWMATALAPFTAMLEYNLWLWRQIVAAWQSVTGQGGGKFTGIGNFKQLGLPGFSGGGIAAGPSSGYLAILHGVEGVLSGKDRARDAATAAAFGVGGNVIAAGPTEQHVHVYLDGVELSRGMARTSTTTQLSGVR